MIAWMIVAFTAGLLVGATLGIIIFAACAMSGQIDDEQEADRG